MRDVWRALRTLLGALLLSIAVATMAAQREALEAAPTIQSVFAPGLKDLTVYARPEPGKTNMEALKKIGSDFHRIYQVKRVQFSIKEPDKFRMDVSAGLVHLVHVIVDGRKTTYVMGVRRPSKPFGDDPGKRQTPMDVGVITPGSLRGYRVEYLGTGQEQGRPVLRFRLRYAHDTARYELLWVDSERKCLVKRTLHTRMFGEKKCEYTYHDPQRVGSVWIPTRVEVRNKDGELAGVMLQSDFKVNSGLADSLFEL